MLLCSVFDTWSIYIKSYWKSNCANHWSHWIKLYFPMSNLHLKWKSGSNFILRSQHKTFAYMTIYIKLDCSKFLPKLLRVKISSYNHVWGLPPEKIVERTSFCRPFSMLPSADCVLALDRSESLCGAKIRPCAEKIIFNTSSRPARAKVVCWYSFKSFLLSRVFCF